MPEYKPGEYCDKCQTLGTVECYCGGDLCVCGQQELNCPLCKGASAKEYHDEEDEPRAEESWLHDSHMEAR